jgi:hypothetical protein
MALEYTKEATLFQTSNALRSGGMAERLKAAVLKTAKGESPS